jgi:hypothetical protein
MKRRRGGSMDDRPNLVPSADLGPALVPLGKRDVHRRLVAMRHHLAAGRYEDDLDPAPRFYVGDRGDESGWDPAQAGSA